VPLDLGRVTAASAQPQAVADHETELSDIAAAATIGFEEAHHRRGTVSTL